VVSVASAPGAVVEPGLETALAGLDASERALVVRAHQFAAPLYEGKRLGTGEPAIDHALGLAANLASLRLDAAARAAGLLYAVPEYLADAGERLAAQFDATVAALVAGVWKLNRLRVVTRGLGAQGQKEAARQTQTEVLRNMLLAMVEDIRVVLIRLASRTQTLRFLAHAPDELRRPMARETLDIYAPLANRLGVWQLKWELEDLSFRFLEPELYKRIAKMLDERRVERETFIAEAIGALSRALAAAGVRAEVSGRPKHIFSIYSKMQEKGLDFAELYDVRGLRVLVDDVQYCYTALGVVHDLWPPIPQEFDDYIARPKGNDYRSLHTRRSVRTAARSRCRSARTRCTGTPSSGWRRTGATRKARADGKNRSTRRSPGCARCSRGATRWSMPRSGSSSRSAPRSTRPYTY